VSVHSEDSDPEAVQELTVEGMLDLREYGVAAEPVLAGGRRRYRFMGHHFFSPEEAFGVADIPTTDRSAKKKAKALVRLRGLISKAVPANIIQKYNRDST